ncbi:GGDEF domain-containing protein [Pseudonocardia sp. CA-107938]|uniref:GGDEF domain-containing protein n=1 Tax=Pseudonocardia sp. CA-107938 TaxID=3240021 RepID=UPI003D8D551F
MSAVTRWPVWSLPGRLLGAVLAVEALALLLVVLDVVTTVRAGFSAGAVADVALTLALLTGAGFLTAELAVHVERLRSRVVHGGASTADVDPSPVWAFAAALLLPPLAACAVVTAMFCFVRYRVRRRSGRSPLFKAAFTFATLILAVHAAAAMAEFSGLGAAQPLRSGIGVLVVASAVLGFVVVNTCLVVGVVVMSSDKTVRDMVGQSGDEVLLEVAALCVGGLIAMAVITQPWLVLFAVPPLLVLHRAVLVRQLEKQAATDSKTGLLTAGAWHDRATLRIDHARDAGSSAAVLVVDLDHFKQVNDRHGHIAGDYVLQAVAALLREDVRGADLVGRFGGEEFVLLLPQAGDRYAYSELQVVAERIRRRVAELQVAVPTPDGTLTIDGLSVSVGGAVFPHDGNHLLDVLAVADTALYAAKRAGRNAVRMGRHDTVAIRPDEIVDPPVVRQIEDATPPA